MKGLGCFTWIGLMLAAGGLGVMYFAATNQRENGDFLIYLAVPLAVVAYFINDWLDKREKEREAQKKKVEDKEWKRDFEDRKWLEKVDPEEARKQRREREEERDNRTCYACQMRIPVHASICPYCRTKFK